MIVVFLALVFFAGATAGAALMAIANAASHGDDQWIDR